jgi:RimJ/RimL family protein N-acetyltransferase
MLPDTIDGEGFRLRPFRLTDVEPVFTYASDEAFLRFLRIATPYARSDAETFLAKQALLDREINPSWAIEVDGVPCGGVNIRFLADHRVSEIGYGVARRLWGQGIATVASRVVIAAAFKAYPMLERVRARADARNAGSIRVMEKLGMKREGLLRCDRLCRGELIDEVVYGLLRSEWKRFKSLVIS